MNIFFLCVEKVFCLVLIIGGDGVVVLVVVIIVFCKFWVFILMVVKFFILYFWVVKGLFVVGVGVEVVIIVFWMKRELNLFVWLGKFFWELSGLVGFCWFGNGWGDLRKGLKEWGVLVFFEVCGVGVEGICCWFDCIMCCDMEFCCEFSIILLLFGWFGIMLDCFGIILICLEGLDFLEEIISGEFIIYNGFLLFLKFVLYLLMFNILLVVFVMGGVFVLFKCLLMLVLDCRINKGEFIFLILVLGIFVFVNIFDFLFCIGVEIVVVVWIVIFCVCWFGGCFWFLICCVFCGFCCVFWDDMDCSCCCCWFWNCCCCCCCWFGNCCWFGYCCCWFGNCCFCVKFGEVFIFVWDGIFEIMECWFCGGLIGEVGVGGVFYLLICCIGVGVVVIGVVVDGGNIWEFGGEVFGFWNFEDELGFGL